MRYVHGRMRVSLAMMLCAVVAAARPASAEEPIAPDPPEVITPPAEVAPTEIQEEGEFGPLIQIEAIEVARRTGHRLVLAAAENDYYRQHVASRVDGHQIVYAGEVSHADKVTLLGNARALVYPVRTPESFGLVLAEAAACGTPVAALRCGAVDEIVEDGVTGFAFPTLDELVSGLPRVLALDRARIREAAVARFGVDRMVAGYAALYAALASGSPRGA